MTIELNAPGARLLIEPSAGGRLHQLFVESEGAEWPLLKSPHDAAAHHRDPLSGGCYPMAPWPNRLRDGSFEWRGKRFTASNGREHAIHGLLADKPWDVVARAGRVVEMTCDFGPGWPLEGRTWQRIELGAGFLAMKMEVRSAREAFPAGCGWHPWFRRDVAGSSEVRVTVPAMARYVFEDKLPTAEVLPVADEKLLDGAPLGERRLDDCYTGFEGPGISIIDRVGPATPGDAVRVPATAPAGVHPGRCCLHRTADVRPGCVQPRGGREGRSGDGRGGTGAGARALDAVDVDEHLATRRDHRVSKVRADARLQGSSNPLCPLCLSGWSERGSQYFRTLFEFATVAGILRIGAAR